MTVNKWGALASFFLAISLIVAPLIYLTGNLRDASGVFAYGLADFLYGPILSASIVTVAFVLRERLGGNLRRMDLALLSAVLSAFGMAAVALIRASNRHYHLIHPELGLESAETVLIVWTTLVTGVNATGFHFLGWMFVCLGSSTWTSRLFPRLISACYFLAGVSALFVYLIPELEGAAAFFGVIIGIWQGILLWKLDTHPYSEVN